MLNRYIFKIAIWLGFRIYAVYDNNANESYLTIRKNIDRVKKEILCSYQIDFFPPGVIIVDKTEQIKELNYYLE